MENLAANNVSGVSNRAGSFAYFGPGTGTSPLPTYLAYLNGEPDADNPAAYTRHHLDEYGASPQDMVQTEPEPGQLRQ